MNLMYGMYGLGAWRPIHFFSGQPRAAQGWRAGKENRSGIGDLILEPKWQQRTTIVERGPPRHMRARGHLGMAPCTPEKYQGIPEGPGIVRDS